MVSRTKDSRYGEIGVSEINKDLFPVLVSGDLSQRGGKNMKKGFDH